MGTEVKDEDRSDNAPAGEHKPNPHHNAEMPADHKAELEKHDICISPGHKNQGHGHH